MKTLILSLLLVASQAWADTTPNLIGNGVGTGSGQWWGMSAYSQLNGQHPIAVFGCCTSYGSGPFFDSSTGGDNGQSGQFIWSYGQATVSQIIAVNQALSGTGIQISGYNWGYEIRNMNGDDRQGGVDTLTARILTYAPDNVTLRRSDSWTYNTKFDWTAFSGTVNYINPGPLSDFGNLKIEFESRDSGGWAGYYGPQVRNVDLSLNYTNAPVDPCVNNPLSSPSCPGYQQAYHDQQCSINSLYATSCPGYQQAYYTQQCSINPLYDSTCPGYQAAYYNQQCTLDPLYDTGCPGYQQAYFDQQCAADSLYNNQCPGYQSAYFDQQCSLDPLYNNQCPGYQAAYFNQQCGLDPLYNASCAGYQSAYFALQCSISPLYDTTCPGYQTAFFNQQCTANALYDSACPGYQQAYYDQQCAANPLYDSGCANYDLVYSATQPPVTEEPSTSVVAQADITSSVSAASEPTAATSTTSPTSVSPAAVISAVRPVPAPAAPAPSSRAQSAESARQETRAAEQKTEQKRTDRAVARAVPPGATGRAAAQAAAERAEEAVADAAAATTIEAQQAAQNLVLGLMGFNPAFSAYQNAIVPDTNAAVMARQYNQPTVDNRRALRGLSGASDRMHQDMVDQQYGRMPR